MLRNFWNSVLLSAAALAAGSFSAAANITISNAPTQNMSCAGGVCVPTGATAVLNVTDLENLLASGNVKITTTGTGIQATDIRLGAKLDWSSSNTLSLDAYKSVSVDKPVSVKGNGGFAVITNDGGNKGEFSFGAGGHLTFANLSSSLAINGVNYSLVSNIGALATAITVDAGGAFALANNYDASRDGTYATPPVSTVFTGAFNGLGNTISNLTINDPVQNAYVGLFAETSGNASLSSVRLTNENVTGGSGTQSLTTEYVGGLVGFQEAGTISNIFAAGAAIAGSYAAVGGVAGVTFGTVTASGSAAGASCGYLGAAGGLVGGVGGTVTNSYATGDVSGSGYVGGLVGFNSSDPIDHSFATGTVTGIDTYTYAGGLIGMNYSSVTRSSASGAVNCESACGGLAGMNGGDGASTISQSFATGNVSAGSGGAGGLVGVNLSSVITDSYALGVTSGTGAGGLVASNAVSGDTIGISHSYSAGVVAATEYVGGLIAVDDFTGSLKQNYWDTTTSGVTEKSQGAGNVENDPGIKGLSNTKLTSGLPKGFSPRVWAENPDINAGLPYLIANPPPK
jgi:hypothetical protein